MYLPAPKDVFGTPTRTESAHTEPISNQPQYVTAFLLVMSSTADHLLEEKSYGQGGRFDFNLVG